MVTYTPQSCKSLLQDTERNLMNTIRACPINRRRESIKLMNVRFNVKGKGQKVDLKIRNVAVGCVAGNLGILPGTPVRGFLDAF